MNRLARDVAAEKVAMRLACPRCYGSIVPRDDVLHCEVCDVVGVLRGEIASFQSDAGLESYFDQRIEQLNTTTANNWAFSYAEPVSLLGSYLKDAMILLDIGCGSRLPYEPRQDAFVIGVDLSAEALRANRRLDLRVHSSAAALPVRPASIHLIICFYSLHHMIGRTIQETRGNVIACLRECARALNPGGTLFIVENNPRGLFRLFQRWGWAPAKRILRRHLDMFFWTRQELDQLLLEATGHPAARILKCESARLALISPFFAIPQFKVFRFMHPLNCSVSVWRKRSSSLLAQP